MNEQKLAVVTGADGGMGQCITKALAQAGYRIIMACLNLPKANAICEQIKQETGHEAIEVRQLQLASLASMHAFCEQLLLENNPIHLLMNNAGILSTPVRKTEDGLETIVSVNYIGPYFLTRKLLPLLQPGSRIVNTVSCTYAIGQIGPSFFEKGKEGHFSRIPVYGNTKLALLLFTQELNRRIADQTMLVNAADPGIVSTNMITMQAWFDPLTDIIFRPFIKTAAQGAATAIYLALSDKVTEGGCCYANCKPKKVADRILHHPQQLSLWNDTEQLLASKGYSI